MDRIIYNKQTRVFSKTDENKKKSWIEDNCTVIDDINTFMPNEPWITVIMNDCYLTSGTSIDKISKETDQINLLIDLGITKVESTFNKDEYHKYPVANIGFCPNENKWYGWSHRAIHGFGIGDIPKEFYPDKTIEGKKIENLDEAKEAAKKFAESVA